VVEVENLGSNLTRFRVPGGWIYERFAYGAGAAMAFVPDPEQVAEYRPIGQSFEYHVKDSSGYTDASPGCGMLAHQPDRYGQRRCGCAQ
jgi:hypothetical protein